MTQPTADQHRDRAAIRRSITIGRTTDEVARAFKDEAFLARLVDHQEADDERRGGWHWLSGVFGGRAGEARAQVVDERPGESLRWRWEEDGEERGEGTVSFRSAPGGRGAEVAVDLRYDARGGAPRRWVEKMLGTDPGQRLTRDLYRLRQLIETGEIASTVGQPAAREATGGVLVSAVGQPSGRADQ